MNRTENILEFDKIKTLWADNAVTDAVKEQIKNIIFTAANKAIADGALENAELRDFTIEVPKDRANGDYAINAAMVWSRLFKKAPRQIAEILMANASFEGTYIEKYEIAGPGFINFYLSQKYYADIVFPFNKSVIIDEDVKEKIYDTVPLIPLHGPAFVHGLEAVTSLLPNKLQVEVTDKAGNTKLLVLDGKNAEAIQKSDKSVESVNKIIKNIEGM